LQKFKSTFLDSPFVLPLYYIFLILIFSR